MPSQAVTVTCYHSTRLKCGTSVGSVEIEMGLSAYRNPDLEAKAPLACRVNKYILDRADLAVVAHVSCMGLVLPKRPTVVEAHISR